MRFTKSAAVIAAVTMAAALAGCGSDPGASRPHARTSSTTTEAGAGSKGKVVPAAKWAESFCAAMTDWTTDMGRDGVPAPDPDATPAELRDGLVERMEASQASAHRLVTGIEGSGTPDVDDGAELMADLTAALTEFETLTESAIADAKALPVTSKEDYDDAAVTVTSAYGDQVNGIAQTLSEMDLMGHPEIASALYEACSI